MSPSCIAFQTSQLWSLRPLQFLDSSWVAPGHPCYASSAHSKRFRHAVRQIMLEIKAAEIPFGASKLTILAIHTSSHKMRIALVLISIALAACSSPVDPFNPISLEARGPAEPVDCPLLLEDTQVVSEGYNRGVPDHFYTLTPSEISTSGLKDCGVAFRTFTTATPLGAEALPLYRLNSVTNNDHYYTVSDTEKTAYIAAGYVDEGQIGYVSKTPACGRGTTSGTRLAMLYRMYNPASKDHWYSVDPDVIRRARKAGYLQEDMDKFTAFVWVSDEYRQDRKRCDSDL
ncbi:hypothetical protein HGRIS_007298 [Hohenbuehelia grisea]|uniref:DUF5648 domain-containing protein n=1 Tax=Hohenbuehelia grisea TaxID=104357 RepID=A0ABR3J4I3_9AGAR